MKFKKFINEMEGVSEIDPNVESPLSKIKVILNTMNKYEINNFGEWLYDSIYDEDFDDLDDDDYDEDNAFTLDEVIELVSSLDSDDLNYVYNTLVNSYGLDDDDIADAGAGNTEDYDDDNNITEKKYFKKRKSVLDREKKHDIAQRRKNRKQRHLEYKRHKAKILRKQKLYRRKVKMNPNIVKTHR